MTAIVWVMLGGAIGAALRFGLGKSFPFDGQSFPLGTFWINGLGCLMIGILIGYLEKKSVQSDFIRWFLISGLCGGFTTFSAFSMETILLIQQARWPIAITYVLSSVIVGLLLTWTGWWVMRA